MSTTNDTTNSSDNVHTTSTSTSTTSLSPTWAPPKAPLPPHRLAKLANALGVSTPIPVHHRIDRVDRSPSPYLVPSPALSLNTPDAYASIRETYASLRRSPTPSSAGSVVTSGMPYTFTSKFLLHVIPPVYLPHNAQLRDNVPSGSGYHSQFRRGTLVSIHPTLQAQLWAIAKEYALPSITGIVLYIVNTSQPAQDRITPTGAEDEAAYEEPGPRLSEEIWKHLWIRVWKAEREELPPALAPLGLPGPVTSPPLFAIDSGTPISPLRPFLSSTGIDSPDTFNQAGTYPSPSTPSSASTLAFTRFLHSRSPTSESPETDTPPTSHSNSLDDTDANLLRANSFPLPGLNSPSLMPILAKVEFDIDRRKAGWYEPWAKRRRVKKQKKVKSDTLVNNHPKRLKLAGKAQAGRPGSAFSWKDQSTSESLTDDDEEEDEEDDIGDEDETARVLSPSGPSSRFRRNIHDLDDDDSESEDGGVEQSELTKGAEEISEIMAQMGQKPSRSNSLSKKRIPPPLILHPAGGAASKELKVPSPLNSATFTPPGSSSSSSGSTSLPYLKGVSPHNGAGRYNDDPEGSEFSNLMDDEVERYRTKSPLESEKRTGGVYDDLDLDLGELDDDDPHDRRRSQIIFKAKLDEIERNLAQLSPRALKSDLEDEQFPQMSARISSPGSPFLGIPASGQGTPILMNSDILPPASGNFNGSPTRPRKGSTATSTSPSRAQWPAVPYSVLTEDEDTLEPTRRSRAESNASPPRLAINGVSTFAPHAFKRHDSLSGSSDISAETMKRRKEAEEEQSLYPAFNPLSSGSENSSPIIPLSPDPFGRFSSTPEPPEGTRHNIKVWDKVPFGGSVEQLIQNSKQRRTTSISSTGIKEVPPRNSEASSRFSADSSKDNIEVPTSIVKHSSGSFSTSTGNKDNIKEKTGNRTTVMSMKGIKKLWRKSNKTSVSMAVPPTPIPESPVFPPGYSADEPLDSPHIPSLPSTRAPSPQSLQNLPQSSAAPVRPTRPSKEELDIPDIPDQLAIPLQPANGRPAPMPIIAAQMQVGLHLRSSASGDRMQFDQESPYPMPSRRPQPRKMSVSMNSVQSAPHPPTRTPSPASSTGGSIGAAAGASVTGENRQANVRKSILKWKAAAAVHQNGEQMNSNGSSSRSSSEHTASGSTVRPRAPSFSTGSHRSSISIADIPPSPKIPEHFLASRTPPEHLRTGSHLTNSSTDSRLTTVTDISSFQSLNSPPSSQTSHGSPPSKLKTDLNRNSSLDSNAKLSMDSGGPRKTSFDSQFDRHTTDDDDAFSDTRPSIDSSQFEMVSPKMEVGTLSYPYTTVGMHQ